MKPAICMEMLYPGLEPEQKIERIARAGFHAIEFWDWRDKHIPSLQSYAHTYGLSFVNFSGQRKGDLIDASTHDLLLQEIDMSLEVARALGTRTLMVLSNELGEGGRVLHPCSHLSETEKHSNMVTGLKKILQRLPGDMMIIIEPLNTVLDHEGCYLAHMKDAIRIVEEIGDPHLRVLCDFYHLALMNEDPCDIIERWAPFIGHVHIADYPGRYEPGTGRGPWKEVLRQLQRADYRGYVGFEYSPHTDSDTSLYRVRQLWQEVFGTGAAM